MGSADEMRIGFRYCLDLGYVDETTWQDWRQDYLEIAKRLQGLNKAVKSRIRSPISVLCSLTPVAERSVSL